MKTLFPLATVLVLALSPFTGNTHAAQVPFVLPWNDASAGPTDLSSLNHPILDSSDRVRVDTEAHFAAGGRRVRFVGVNFAGDSPFTPTNKAEAVAGRLAKFGVNCVRFHHMDAPWALGGGLISYGSTSRNLNPAQLEKLHYLVARLKAHGVYANINLLVGRQFLPGDGLPAEIGSMDWKDQHVVGYFNDAALGLHKEYARKLLTPINPFTGQSLAQDPAVAFVEIINENGLVQKWFDLGLDRLPAVFAAQLQSRWNDWLAAGYGTDASLLAAWQLVDQPLGPNLLRNGSFSAGYTGWVMEQQQGAAAQFTTPSTFNGRPAAQIQVVTPGSAGWHVQLNQPGITLTGGTPYTFSFWAKASQAGPMDASVMEAHPNWLPLGYTETLPLTPEWKQVSVTFLATGTDANSRPNFGGFATRAVTVSIADVRLQAGGKVGQLPAGATLASRTIPNIPRNSSLTFTTQAKADWVRFLLSLEERYLDAMTATVRQECSYPGLLFGTIIANSPPNTQARLDVIDAHAYWQHPVFPRQAWDPVDWYLNNLSMLNTTADDNTIAWLSRQRVKGKPFTVTEYGHPAPNYYSAEGPLLLASYGALQDWDGLWLFAYGRGNDTTTMGYVPGFFDIGQHPTQMVQLLLAAAIFRRGDVQPALKEYTLPLTPEQEVSTIVSKGAAWHVCSAQLLGMPTTMPLVSRVNLSVGPNASGLPSPPPAPVAVRSALTSDTGELRWLTSGSGKGSATVNTPRTKSVAGFTDAQSITLGGVVFEPGTTLLGWSSLALTLLEGDSLTNNARALLIAAGQVDNTGMQWKDASRNSVGNHWGGPPVLAEIVPFHLTLPVSADRVKVSALDPRGQRLQELPVESLNGLARFAGEPATGSLWYEVLVSPPSGFDRWRFTQFTAAELADPAISGDGAAPAGDQFPNLLKYALGLPAKIPASHGAIQGQRIVQGGTDHLAIEFVRIKNAADLEYQAEVSGDLTEWSSGPDRTEITRVLDLGDREQVTIRDLESIPQHAQRSMRLKILRIR